MIIKILSLSLALLSPLGLDWSKSHSTVPEVPDYTYYYGDIYFSPIVYTGREDILGLETEIHLHIARHKIAKAVLILGPAGMDEYDCKRKYKEVVSFLSKKYGHYTHTSQIKEAEIEDLVFSAKCYPMMMGIETIRTHWRTPKYQIDASLLGDAEGLYIEITYTDRNRIKKYTKDQESKIIKKLSKEL
jgi:hypothetical protein